MSSADNPPRDTEFRIAIVGAGPVGKLLACSVTPHPCISYELFHTAAEQWPAGKVYDIGPEVSHTLAVLNPKLAAEIKKRTNLGQNWLRICTGGRGDQWSETIKVPEGRLYGSIGRQELTDLLDSHLSPRHRIQPERRLASIEKARSGLLELRFNDQTDATANAVWLCDGTDSAGRKALQGQRFMTAEPSGDKYYHCQVQTSELTSEVGTDIVTEKTMFVSANGWYILISPHPHDDVVDIVGFVSESGQGKDGYSLAMSSEEFFNQFPHHNDQVDKILKLLERSNGDEPQRLNNIRYIEPFYDADLCMTCFGDAASPVLHHLGGVLSPGFIGVSVFLHEAMNPLINRLSIDATDEEIASLIMEASALYDVTHRELTQMLMDYNREQGSLWSNGPHDIDELTRRLTFLWTCADSEL